MVLIDLDDLAAHAASDLAQLPLLVGGGLVEGRDTKVKNGVELWAEVGDGIRR
jgi:hypothetical protein